MKKKMLLIAIFLLNSCYLLSQNLSMLVDCQTPGYLSSKLTYSEQQQVECLRVTGYINETDMSFINGLIKNQKINVLDLSDVVVIDSKYGENHIWEGFIDFGDYKTIQKIILPYKAAIISPYDNGRNRIKSRVDTLEIAMKEIPGNICSYPPRHLRLLDGVEIINSYAFDFGDNKTDTCVFELSNTIKRIGKYAFGVCCSYNGSLIFPDNIEYIGGYPYKYDDYSHDYGSNIWWENTPYRSKNLQNMPISSRKFEFPKNLKYYNSLDYYTLMSGGTHHIRTRDIYESDTIVVYEKCDTLLAQLKARVAYFYNPKPIKFYLSTDLEIGTIYVPEEAFSEYKRKYSDKNILPMSNIKSLKINLERDTIDVGEKIKCNVSLYPQNVFYKNIVYSTSDENIIEINNDGEIFAHKPGDAYVFVRSAQNSSVIDSCKIRVRQHVESLELNLDRCELKSIGEILKLQASVIPETSDNKQVLWRSSNETVCVVTNGTVVAVGYGIAVVIATSVDGGHIATCTVVVKNQSGLDNVINEENLPVEYYDLNGVKLDKPKNGLLIKKQGHNVNKVIL